LPSVRLLGRLEVDHHLYFVAQEEPALLQRLVPQEAVVLPVEGRLDNSDDELPSLRLLLMEPPAVHTSSRGAVSTERGPTDKVTSLS